MDIKEIQNLLKFVEKLEEINEVKLEMDDFKITIKRGLDKKKEVFYAQPQQMVLPQMPSMPQVQPQVATEAPASTQTSEENSKYITMTSPIIGTFYRRPAPGKPLLVEVGDTISVGQPLCIIEAMKLFNEIESEVSGKIVKVLVEDASPVEFGQPLFLIDPA